MIKLISIIHRATFLIAVGFSLLGCATTLSPKAQQVQAADNSMVQNCRFLGDVQGSSGWGNLAASQGMQNSRNEAQEQAANLGATHVVWVNISGGYSPYAIGKAYQCP